MISSMILRYFKNSHGITTHSPNSVFNNFKGTILLLNKTKKILKLEDINSLEENFKKIQKETPRNIPMAVHCFSFIKESKDFLVSFEKEIIKNINEYDKDSLIYIIRAYSRREIKDYNLFQLLCSRIITIIASFNADDINKIIFALYKIGYKDTEFFNKLGEQAQKSIHKISLPRLSDIIQSLSLIKNEDFLKNCIEIIEKNLNLFNNLDKIYMIKSFRDCNLILESLEKNVIENINQLTNEEFATLCSFIILTENSKNKFKDALKASLIQRELNKFTTKDSLLIINAFHELNLGKEICEMFYDDVLLLLSKYTSSEYSLIMYIYGINQISKEKL